MLESGECNLYTGPPLKRVNSEQFNVEVEIMQASGLNNEQIARLAIVKIRVDAGQCNDFTPEHIRLMFFKKLHEDGKLQG